MLKKSVMIFGLFAGTVPLAYGGILGTLDDIASATQAIHNISQENHRENAQPVSANQTVECPAGYTCTPKEPKKVTRSFNDNEIAPSLRHVPGVITLHSTPFPSSNKPQETTQEAADQAAAKQAELDEEASQPRVGNPVDRRFESEIKAQSQGTDDNAPIQ